MTDEQYYHIMMAIGFGFGSLFWPFLVWLLFKAK